MRCCETPTEAPSHGGGESSVRYAHYRLENRGTEPVIVELIKLEVLDPKDQPMPLAIDYANVLPGNDARRQGTDERARHRVRFRVDGISREVRASELYLRYPGKR